jgi:hypothetical protein
MAGGIKRKSQNSSFVSSRRRATAAGALSNSPGIRLIFARIFGWTTPQNILSHTSHSSPLSHFHMLRWMMRSLGRGGRNKLLTGAKSTFARNRKAPQNELKSFFLVCLCAMASSGEAVNRCAPSEATRSLQRWL